jgi:hypothetical protein
MQDIRTGNQCFLVSSTETKVIEGQDLQSGRKARSWGHTTIGVGTQFKHLHHELGPLLIVTKKFMPVLQDERDWKPKQRRFFFAVSTVTHYKL